MGTAWECMFLGLGDHSGWEESVESVVLYGCSVYHDTTAFCLWLQVRRQVG